MGYLFLRCFPFFFFFSGYYVYIESSAPRKQGDKAWLVSSSFLPTNAGDCTVSSNYCSRTILPGPVCASVPHVVSPTLKVSPPPPAPSPPKQQQNKQSCPRFLVFNLTECSFAHFVHHQKFCLADFRFLGSLGFISPTRSDTTLTVNWTFTWLDQLCFIFSPWIDLS